MGSAMIQCDLPGGRYQLQLSLPVLIPALFVTALLMGLGVWQLSRASEKQFLLQQADLGPQPLEHFSNSEVLIGKAVTLDGHFLFDQSLLLDNRIWQQRVGYQAIVPFKLHHTDQLILINIGFLPAPAQRSQLPTIDPIGAALNGDLTLSGRLKSLQDQVMVLASETLPKQPQWPLRVQSIDVDALQPYFQGKLQPVLLLLDEELSMGYPRSWPVTTISVEKHQAYAVQWFAMALVFVAILLRSGIRNVRGEMDA
jgi:surfeit locus 1 family protein